jgi:hypothetical protein
MKKFALGLALAMALVASVSAQAAPNAAQPPQGQPAIQAQAPVAKSIEGKLLFVDDKPALQTKDKTYILRFPRFYYYAYTDGFKAGDQMKLDGYEVPAVPGQDKPVFIVTKAVVGSKTYDFTAAYSMGMLSGGRGVNGGNGMGGMMGPGGCDGNNAPMGRGMMGRGRW